MLGVHQTGWGRRSEGRRRTTTATTMSSRSSSPSGVQQQRRGDDARHNTAVHQVARPPKRAGDDQPNLTPIPSHRSHQTDRNKRRRRQAKSQTHHHQQPLPPTSHQTPPHNHPVSIQQRIDPSPTLFLPHIHPSSRCRDQVGMTTDPEVHSLASRVHGPTHYSEVPQDARLITLIIASMGIQDIEPGVEMMLLEWAHREWTSR